MGALYKYGHLEPTSYGVLVCQDEIRGKGIFVQFIPPTCSKCSKIVSTVSSAHVMLVNLEVT